jgi:hypothetical protein
MCHVDSDESAHKALEHVQLKPGVTATTEHPLDRVVSYMEEGDGTAVHNREA